MTACCQKEMLYVDKLLIILMYLVSQKKKKTNILLIPKEQHSSIALKTAARPTDCKKKKNGFTVNDLK